MLLQEIQGELYLKEFVAGDELIKKFSCNSLGHSILTEKRVLKTCVIPKGVCGKCGEGFRYFKMSKKQTEDFRKEMESVYLFEKLLDIADCKT